MLPRLPAPRDGARPHRRRLLLLPFLSLGSLSAQDVPPPPAADQPDPAVIARFDTNRDGRLDASEMAAMRRDTAATSSRPGGDIIELSPFVVDSSRDVGYQATNTLAGSRLNSSLADIAASITVVTKQQLEDTASTDINDVFRYEANTEGSSTYTPQILNRNFVNDPVAGTAVNGVDAQTNATANRVRGLGVPTTSLNYYATNPRIPFDSYNTQSVEISRGPNSMLFGLGSPAGIVNSSTSQASLARDGGSVSATYGSYGSYRVRANFNEVLVDDKVALYGAFLHDDRQFERKPSYDITDRYYGALTIKPFENTLLRGALEWYDNENRRPNFITPRDYVTPWLNAGRPVYNPITRSVTRLATGVTTPGALVLANTSPFYTAGYNTGDAALHSQFLGNTTNPNPQYVPGIFFNDTTRPVLRLDGGQLVDWFQKQPVQVIPAFAIPPAGQTGALAALPTTGTIYANPASAAIFERRWTVSGPPASPTWTDNGTTYTLSTYSWPGVTNPEIYDWTTHNINQPNYGYQQAYTFNVELEQKILDNLFFNAGWFRQDFDSADNYTISQQQSATLYVDTNTHLPNGDPNPYVGIPYVEDFAPDTSLVGEIRDTVRAILAYNKDFTGSDNGLVRMLGRHQVMANWSLETVVRLQERRRTAFVAGDQDATLRYLPNPNNNATTGPTGWNYQGISIRRNYYLGSPGDPMGTVSQAAGTWGQPGWGGPDSGRIEVYDWTTGQFKEVQVTLDDNVFDASSFRSEREVESLNFGTQSAFWDDRLILTVGFREDDYRARVTTNGIIYAQQPDPTTGKLVQETPAMTNPERWVNGIYQTDVVYNRWQRWDELSGTTSTRGLVFRPFARWKAVGGDGSSRPNFFQEFVRDLSLTYNTSDNFNPPSAAQVDAFGNELAKPEGDGKDWGVRFSVLGGKVSGGINFFEASNANERTGAANLILGRLTSNLDTTIFRNWAATVIRIRDGEDPTAQSFGSAPLTAAQEARIAQLWGLPTYDYYGNLPAAIGATQNSVAEGYEAQMTFNPSRSWTMKVTFGKQESIYDDIAPQYDAWLAERLPVMQAANALDLPANRRTYTTFGGTQVDLSNFWSSYGYRSEVRLTNTDGNTNPSNYYTNVVDSQYSLAKAQEGVAAPNQRKYRGSLVTNYRFQEGALKGFGLGGAVRWESKAALGYYGRAANPLTPTVINAPDPNRPIFDSGNEYVDLWCSYQRPIFDGKVQLKLQFNVANVFEDGSLQPIAVNYDGSPFGYRIIDPREFKFTTTFEF